MLRSAASDLGLHCLQGSPDYNGVKYFVSTKLSHFSFSPRKYILKILIRITFAEALLMNIFNICYCGEIRKILM